jgi:hypothetical protein
MKKRTTLTTSIVVPPVYNKSMYMGYIDQPINYQYYINDDNVWTNFHRLLPSLNFYTHINTIIFAI